MLAAFLRDRDVIGPDRSIDVRFDDFMADELGVTEQIYALAGEPVTDEARAAMADYLAGAPTQSARPGRDVVRDVRARRGQTCASGSRRTSSASCPDAAYPRGN